MAHSKDLFDDSTMSFGEHLEVLRVHLWKALIGLTLCVIVALYFGDRIVAVVRGPIDRALAEHGVEAKDDLGDFDFWGQMKAMFGGGSAINEEIAAEKASGQPSSTIRVKLKASAIAAALHDFDPEAYPAPPEVADEKLIAIELSSPHFARFKKTAEDFAKPVTLNVQEAFMTYIKVACVAGLLLASPWVFYQIWLFVAAGLYPHEQKYVYIYLPVSIGLFLGGAVFCFFAVFPFVLKFLLGFNQMLEVWPQIRLSEWISFAILLPVLFGVSFQLPLVMLFLERISVFEANDYQQKRRMAIFVISIISMLLTPADPMSMMLMMIPLLVLYELGILMCRHAAAKTPFEAEAV